MLPAMISPAANRFGIAAPSCKRTCARSFTATRLEPISGYTDFAAGDADTISGIVASDADPHTLDIRLDCNGEALTAMTEESLSQYLA